MAAAPAARAQVGLVEGGGRGSRSPRTSGNSAWPGGAPTQPLEPGRCRQGPLARSCQGQERQEPTSPAAPRRGQGPDSCTSHRPGSPLPSSWLSENSQPAQRPACGPGHLCAPLTGVQLRRSLRPAAAAGDRGREPQLWLAGPTAQLRFQSPLNENAVDGR